MGLFGRRKHDDSEAGQQLQAEQIRVAAQYNDLVRDGLERLLTWAYPYSQIEGWDIWHASAQGQRIVDVRVTLRFDEALPKSFTVMALSWGDTDIESGPMYSDVELTPADLYDALRRAATEGA